MSRKGGLIVAFVVLPILGPVFYRVGQEEHLTSCRAGHRFHTAILQESRLEDAFPGLSIEIVGFTRGACPHLGNVAVTTLQRGQRCFGRNNLPLRVIEQRVGGHITADIHSFLSPVLLGIGKSLIEGTVVEVILQLIGEIGVLGTFVLGAPGEAVKLLPFTFESLTVSGSRPELRFFQEDGIDACIYNRFYVTFLKVREIIPGGDNIRYQAAVPDGITLSCLLSFVQMPFPVPFACEVILILAPGDTCHKMSSIASITPGIHPFAEGHPTIIVGAIHHHQVGADIRDRFPRSCGLERSLLLSKDRQKKEKENASPHTTFWEKTSEKRKHLHYDFILTNLFDCHHKYEVEKDTSNLHYL